MLRRILIIVTAVTISCLCLSGCKKSPTEPDQETVKTTAEYEAEAKEEISKENMAAELDKIEKQLEKEIGAEE